MDRLNGNGDIISQVSLGDVENHSSFDRRNHNFLSGKLGKIIPTRLDEVYPGDRIKGRIQSVVNFEPLVSPILGNMVLKQESFYIPWHILWKNAYKFVTGKGQFNTPKPQVSPQDILSAYGDHILSNVFDPVSACEIVTILKDEFDAESPHDYTGFLAALSSSDYDFNDASTMMQTFGNTHEVLDILQPYIDKIQHIIYGYGDDTLGDNYTKMIAATGDAKKGYYDACVMALADLYYFVYQNMFGLSSLFDYIGYPVFDGWQKYWFEFFPQYALSYQSLPEGLRWSTDLTKYFSAITFDWLPFRAYYVVWYWNYRDELLETAALDPESDDFLADSPTTTEIVLCTLLRVRCWYKDTFTTALTNTGDGNFTVPLTASYITDNVTFKYYAGDSLLETSDYSSAMQSGATVCQISAGDITYNVPMNYLSTSFANSDSEINSADGISLDMIDRVTRLRKFVQKKLVLGYEYDDVVWSSFLVKLSNVRMRIPEILARGRDVVDINTLVNNTSTSEQSAGDKSAIAWVNGSTSEMNYFAEEHGFYISIMTVLPLQSYAGGMQRLWSKLEQFDIMWPEFASMGMDAVYNFELSAPRGEVSESGLTDAAAMQVFGYQGRYFDLKTRLDEEHGRLRSDLNFLTFSREFNNTFLPKLNYIFVHCWPQTDMFVLADGSEDLFRADVYSALDWQRRLPVPAEYI